MGESPLVLPPPDHKATDTHGSSGLLEVRPAPDAILAEPEEVGR